jgi:hypothetical protein
VRKAPKLAQELGQLQPFLAGFPPECRPNSHLLGRPNNRPRCSFAPALPLDSVVEGSVRGVLTVSGEVMSQTLDNLERLIKMPFGCGEQNLM